MRNKILSVVPWLLVAALVLCFVGCKPEPETVTTTKINSTTITSTTTATEATTETVTGTVTETTTEMVTVTETPTTTTTTEPETRTITDMYGRELEVPYHIDSVLCTTPVEMELVFMLVPEKLAGLCFTFNGDPSLVPEEYASLPVTGGWFGKNEGNYETFIAAEPDIIIESWEENIADRQDKFGDIPVVGLDSGDLMFDYEAAIRFLGDLLEVEEQSDELIEYYKDAMLYVYDVLDDIPEADRLKVYYAEGAEGLNTDPLGSQHTALLEFCGGINVADVQLLEGYGMAEVSFEQILLWDPDVIIIGRGSQAALYEEIMTNEIWQDLRAVQDGRVYLRPDNPLSWFDGPPGPGQILGMYWMINTLYPEETTDLDLGAKVEEFYSKFFHYDLSGDELVGLIGS